MWHPLGSNAGQIRELPARGGRRPGSWPASSRCPRASAPGGWGYVGAAADDLALFDDLYACLTAQFGLDRTAPRHHRVLGRRAVVRLPRSAPRGVPDGGAHPQRGTSLPAVPRPLRLPVLLAWGGPTDQYGGVVDFSRPPSTCAITCGPTGTSS
ncbi:MAG: hypothetical protein R3F43_13425 [bacterium]